MQWSRRPGFETQLQVASNDRFGGLTLTSARAAWPLRLAVARKWSGVTDGQAWVLAGDAAHAVHPLAGQGLNLGLADVGELVRQLHGRDYWRAVSTTRRCCGATSGPARRTWP